VLEADIRREIDEYMLGLQQSLDEQMFTVGFVFECVPEEGRVRQLEAMDRSGRPWVVIRTNAREAHPHEATWKSTQEAIAGLGAAQLYVGGCYALVANHRLVPPPTQPTDSPESYSCINDAIVRLHESGLFASVNLLRNGTYVTFLPPS
jgi:hypothetical protein